MNSKTVIALLSAILAAIIIFGIILVSVFNQNFAELKNNTLNSNSTFLSQIGNVGAQMDSMTSNIQTMLDEQESLIAGYSIAYNDPNAQTLKCDVSVTVTPKEYSADTTAVLYIGDKKVPMTQSGNAYATSLSVSLFEVSEASVTFQQGGISNTEVLSEIISAGSVLQNNLTAEPMIDCYLDNNTLLINGVIEMSLNTDSRDTVKSARFYAIKEGKEVWAEDMANPKELENEIPYTISIPFNKRFPNVEYEDAISIYAEVVGNSGFTYRKTIYGSKETDADGVYDANGKLIEFGDYTEN